MTTYPHPMVQPPLPWPGGETLLCSIVHGQHKTPATLHGHVQTSAITNHVEMNSLSAAVGSASKTDLELLPVCFSVASVLCPLFCPLPFESFLHTVAKGLGCNQRVPVLAKPSLGPGMEENSNSLCGLWGDVASLQCFHCFAPFSMWIKPPLPHHPPYSFLTCVPRQAHLMPPLPMTPIQPNLNPL